ncbi:MAG TPA: hypothetical protein VGH43_03285 [Jatrophihabitans sp.]|jgi:hypothetical protein
MSRTLVEYVPAVLTVGRTVDVIDDLADLHARCLSSGPEADQAFADLSDTTCLILGQLLAVGTAGAGEVLATTRRAVEQAGMAGRESVLLSAFLAASGAFSDEIAKTADLVSHAGVLEQLAGGAARVPIVDRVSMSVTTTSLADLAVATRSAGGSVLALATNLRSLATEGRNGPDDATLPAVAQACADGYAAFWTARRAAQTGAPEPGDVARLQDVVEFGSNRWRGPAAQLVAGRALPQHLGIDGAGEGAPPETGIPRAGLAPRSRQGLPAAGETVDVGRQRIPARVTSSTATWIALGASTAELHPPSELADHTPVAAPSGSGADGEADLTTPQMHTVVTVGTQPMKVPGPGAPVLDPLTGAQINPMTGLVVHPPPGRGSGVAIAEAVLREAHLLDVNVATETVVSFVDRLVARRD